MQSRIKKRTVVLLVSYLGAAVLILGILAGTNYRKAEQYRTLVTANYQHAFSELVTALSEMDTALQKSIYCVSPSMVSAVCTEVFGKAMTAQMSLGGLPFSSTELERTSGFISRAGDYAYSLARSAASGKGYSEEQLENLRSLSDTASLLAQNMKALQTDLFDGVLTMDELENARERLDNTEDAEIPSTIGGSMKLIEREFPETPSLIYDGPFSEHIMNAQPKLLEGLAAVDETEARGIAASFTGVSESRLYLSGEREGQLPCYYFSADTGSDTISAAVTKTGGKVIGLVCSRQPGESTVSDDDAEKAAIRFLESRGYSGMAETYRIKQDGVMTVNFAYKQDGVLCYSDLIKVSVALDTGSVCGFESMGYVMSHSQREIPAAAISTADASRYVPSGLELLSSQLVLTPDDGARETLCVELKCTDENERHYLIYVNAQTGEQEKILILLEDETGTLTI